MKNNTTVESLSWFVMITMWYWIWNKLNQKQKSPAFFSILSLQIWFKLKGDLALQWDTLFASNMPVNQMKLVQDYMLYILIITLVLWNRCTLFDSLSGSQFEDAWAITGDFWKLKSPYAKSFFLFCPSLLFLLLTRKECHLLVLYLPLKG